MNKFYLDMVNKAFCNVELDGEYTLLEADFFDTHNRYFDGVDDIYLQNAAKNRPNLILDWGFHWPQQSLEIGLTALEQRARAINPFSSWKDVTFEYLDAHIAAVYLSPIAFRFYFPAMTSVYVVVNESSRDCNFIDSLFTILFFIHEKYINVFNVAQLKCVLYFIDHYAIGSDIDSPEMNLTKKLIKEKIESISTNG